MRPMTPADRLASRAGKSSFFQNLPAPTLGAPGACGLGPAAARRAADAGAARAIARAGQVGRPIDISKPTGTNAYNTFHKPDFCGVANTSTPYVRTNRGRWWAPNGFYTDSKGSVLVVGETLAAADSTAAATLQEQPGIVKGIGELGNWKSVGYWVGILTGSGCMKGSSGGRGMAGAPTLGRPPPVKASRLGDPCVPDDPDYVDEETCKLWILAQTGGGGPSGGGGGFQYPPGVFQMPPGGCPPPDYSPGAALVDGVTYQWCNYTPGQGIQPNDCSGYPNAAQLDYIDGQCWCKTGTVWNADYTGCVASSTGYDQNCNGWPNAAQLDYLPTGGPNGGPGCKCKAGTTWNSDFTACVPSQGQPTQDTNCNGYPNAAQLDYLPTGGPGGTPGCKCKAGTTWNDAFTTCVPVSAKPPAPQPPPQPPPPPQTKACPDGTVVPLATTCPQGGDQGGNKAGGGGSDNTGLLVGLGLLGLAGVAVAVTMKPKRGKKR